MATDRKLPTYSKQNAPDKKAFPMVKMSKEDSDTLDRQKAGVRGGSVMPLELKVHEYAKDHRVYSNNLTEQAAAGRANAPPDRAPSSSPSDLAENLNRQGMGWAKGVK